MELNPVHKTLFKSAAAVFTRQRLHRYCVPPKREFPGFSVSQRAGWMHIDQFPGADSVCDYAI